MQEIEQLSPIEAVRKRPGMYVGSAGFFGLINYLVSPFNLNLAAGAERISASLSDGAFRIDSDVAIEVVDAGDGMLRPFETPLIGGHSLHGCILAALSENLAVTTSHDGLRRTLAYSRGELRSDVEQPSDGSDFTSFAFSPDPTIFTVLNLSPSVFDSYLRRMSYLHPKVRFQFGVGKDLTDYYSENGLPDLFRAITSQYQILHSPIHFRASDGDLQLEMIFAYQSWTGNVLWSFVNGGRAAEGGTHEVGLTKALARFPKMAGFECPAGTLALMSIYYSGVTYEGCVKEKVSTPELTERVDRLATEQLEFWISRNSSECDFLRSMERFQFADIW
jgi:DNA gyrase subunit B